MSKPGSKALEAIKRKVQNSGSAGVHSQLLSPLYGDDSSDESSGNSKKKEEKFDDLYTRHTVYIQNELGDKLSKRSAGSRGEKTRIINEALKEYLNKSE